MIFFKVEGESGSRRVTKFNVAATQFHLEYREDCLQGNDPLLCARERRSPSSRIRERIGGQGIGGHILCMYRILLPAILMMCLTPMAQVQIQYPYNPDANADNAISAPDLLDLLPVFGGPFSPQEIMVGDTTLTDYLNWIVQKLGEQNTTLQSLKGSDTRSLIYPEGLAGLTSVHFDLSDADYVVPEGKNFYLQKVSCGCSEITIWVGKSYPDSVDFYYAIEEAPNGLHYGPHDYPILIGEGMTIGTAYESAFSLSGVLVDQQVQPKAFYGQFGCDADSMSVLTHALAGAETTAVINGALITHLEHDDARLESPLILTGGDSLIANDGLFFLGYMVSKDHFEAKSIPISDESSGSCEEGLVVTYNGYDYSTVQIGDQCWFAENLRSLKYANEDLIPSGLDDATWASTQDGATSIYGEGESGCSGPCDEVENLDWHGRLYNFEAVTDPRGLCPSGWSVPSEQDVLELVDGLGGLLLAAPELAATGGFGGYGMGSTGLNLLPQGWKNPSGYYSLDNAYFMWTRTETLPNEASYYNMNQYLTGIGPASHWFGMSVRCIKEQ